MTIYNNNIVLVLHVNRHIWIYNFLLSLHNIIIIIIINIQVQINTPVSTCICCYDVRSSPNLAH